MKSQSISNYTGYHCLSFCQQTALHVAASKGRDCTVELFVKKGADINIKDKAGVGETSDLSNTSDLR